MSDHLRVRINYDALCAYCREHHISSLAVFGSVLTNEFGPASDVDLLIEFEKGHTPGWEIVGIGDDLSAFFENRPVDMIFPEFIIPRLKKRILNSARPLYPVPDELFASALDSGNGSNP